MTRKTSPDFLMVVNLISPDHSLDRGYISNYALTQVRATASPRLDGVGDARLFGFARLCDARVDRPEQGPRRSTSPGEIVAALGPRTSRSPPVRWGNRLRHGQRLPGQCRNAAACPTVSPQQFAMSLRSDADGRQVRVSDVARVELGAADYASNTYLSGDPTVVLA